MPGYQDAVAGQDSKTATKVKTFALVSDILKKILRIAMNPLSVVDLRPVRVPVLRVLNNRLNELAFDYFCVLESER